MEMLTVPGSVKEVPAFYCDHNPALREVRISEGTEVIGSKAFLGCANLRILHLPATLTNIDMKSFDECGSLTDVYYAGSREQWEKIEISPQGGKFLISARKHFACESTALGSAQPAENHKEEIFAKIRSLLKGGGDGRLHIIAPDLCVDGVLSKTGDLVVLIFPKGSTMMIDTGNSANISRVMDFLRESGAKTLQYMVFSHSDRDHVSNAQAIGEYFYGQPGGKIEHFLWTNQKCTEFVPAFTEYLREKGCKMDMQVLAGRQFDIDGARVKILGPTMEEMRLDCRDQEIRNAQSMIMQVTYGAASYLTSGDLYEGQEAAVVRRCGTEIRAGVMKTNHHGAYTSNSDLWLETVGPRIAFTCNNDNGSTHLTNRMAEMGIAYYSTGCQGTMMISADSRGSYQVLTQYGTKMHYSQRIN